VIFLVWMAVVLVEVSTFISTDGSALGVHVKAIGPSRRRGTLTERRDVVGQVYCAA
jgi:hypothetical protein